MESKRYDIIDVVKGIGIILVVCGHAGSPFGNFIYLFHMSLFFCVQVFAMMKINTNSWRI